ncbi:hypothetical protein N7456_007522 [Penicillium angulare]|uniref:Uncharacterized protein n=1 Tax=Penicillium angulare TaxID=116970 RepID=A0A9W9FAR6_9EURO|nr:hypothetical protein N7456_007522 [Penicillium angulare]
MTIQSPSSERFSSSDDDENIIPQFSAEFIPVPEYDIDQCVAAMKGEKIPDDLNCFWHRRAVIRGIRTSLQFAISPAITNICSGNDSAHQFARARNARLIMSNIIPDIKGPRTEPYCIWYPDLASSETYRTVPVAGVSIAEEAREVDKNAEIYRIIMSAPQRYIVMDDFTRSVNLETPQTLACLKGNMKPAWALDQRRRPPVNLPDETADDIDLEEDGFIGLEYVELEDCDAILGPGDSEQLWMPLPSDLPVLEKRLLAQMAAYDGNVDRYARLMHPRRFRTTIEFSAILRGIYHSTMFAKWWENQLETNPGRVILPGQVVGDQNTRACGEIRAAINARRIMNNDITGIEDSSCLPWMIWHPLKPQLQTLEELMEKCPSMRRQIEVTSVMCDYEYLFRKLEPYPVESLMIVAKRSDNPFYLNYLEAKAAESGASILSDFMRDYDNVESSLNVDLEPGSTVVRSHAVHQSMDDDYGYPPGIYGGGAPARAELVERYAWLSTEAAQEIEDECNGSYALAGIDMRYLFLDSDTIL